MRLGSNPCYSFKKPSFSGQFQLGRYSVPEGEAVQQSPPEINRENLGIDYGGRRPGFVNTIKALAEKVKTQLPDNVMVSVDVGPFGGMAAYDFATIQVLSEDKKKILAEKRFWRATGLSVLLPQFICDALFSRHVMREAKHLSNAFVQNPQATQEQFPPYVRTGRFEDNGPCSGDW
jgi:hypothetical protein